MVDDGQLLMASAHGDVDAFAQFYRRHLAVVVGFGLRTTGDREAAADLAGEVFAAALAAAGRYRAEHPTAAPWLLGIANNKLRESRRRGRVDDAVRRRLRMRPLSLTDDDLERVEAMASQSSGALLEALELLPELEREAVRARVLDERDYRELATEMQCSESVIRQRVSRGLTRMRRHVSQTSNEDPDTSQEGSA